MTMPRPKRSTAAQPLVSVLIPTRNSAKTLARALDAIATQTYPNIELIVIDNNSTDDTKLIAREYTKHVYNHGPERTFQVNFGARKATGKFLYFTGSDLAADQHLVEQAVRACEVDGYDAIYMNVQTVIDNPNKWQRARALERKCYYHQPGMSAARFYKKTTFWDVGGLDEKLGGISDDLEFQHRLDLAGIKTGFIAAYENNFGEYDSVRTIATRSLYYGWQIRRYFQKHPGTINRQYKPVRAEFWNNRHVLMSDKVGTLWLVVYKIVQYAFGGAGLVLCVITRGNRRIERQFYRLNYGSSI